VHPIIVGRGARLFADGVDTVGLRLITSATLRTGVLHLVYAKA
jgi:hypothetical protein